jgi:hypothetical protein
LQIAKPDVLKLKKEVRKQVLTLLREYVGLLNETAMIGAEVTSSMGTNICTLEKIREARELVDRKEFHRAKLLLSHRALKVANNEPLENIMIKCQCFISKLAEAQKLMEAVERRYKRTKWVFFGLMAISGLVLVGSVVAISVCTWGVGAPVAVAAAAASARIIQSQYLALVVRCPLTSTPTDS